MKMKIVLKKKIFLISCLILFLVFCNVGHSAIAPSAVPPSDEAIIILTTNTFAEMHAARKIIEGKGVRVTGVFPPSVFVGIVPQKIAAQLQALEFINALSYSKVNPIYFNNYESSTRDAIGYWNYSLDERAKPKLSSAELEQQAAEEPFSDDVIFPTDIPKTKEELEKKNAEYLAGWKAKGELINDSVASGFGRAGGAGYYDTSLYMAGDIAVGIFFIPGTAGDWTPGEIDSVFNSTCGALSQFSIDEPNAHITFTFVKEVDDMQLPRPVPMDRRDYVNDLRNISNTHWAYMIVVAKGYDRAYATLFGPYTYIFSEDLRGGYTIRHETMHIFGVLDQYATAYQSPISRFGYLNSINANSQYRDGNGYFGGAGEGAPDIMIGGSGIINPIGVYARGQIGWRDSDGDGILDMLDTIPDTEIISKTGAVSFTYIGRASDRAFLNNLGFYGSVTLNTITKVEYRINGSDWYPAAPADGAYDNYQEDFGFTTPELPNGHYTIEIRATNSVNNNEVRYATDYLEVANSAIKDYIPPLKPVTGLGDVSVLPEAIFTITPENQHGAMPIFNIHLDASQSRSSDGSQNGLQVRWDFDDDGIWDTSYADTLTAEHNYATPLSLRLLGTYRSPIGNQYPSQVVAVGDYIYYYSAGLNVVDVHDPAQAALIGTTTTIGYGNLTVAGHYAYNIEDNNIKVLDISDPVHPVILGSCGGYARPYAIGVHGTYLYLIIFDRVQIFNVADPYRPFLAATTPLISTGGCVKDGYVHSINYRSSDNTSVVSIYDFRTPTAPVLMSTYECIGRITDMKALGNYAYLAMEAEGLRIVDLTDRANPRIITTYNMHTRRICISGQYAYLATNTNTIFVLDISNPEIPTPAAGYLTGLPLWIEDIAIEAGRLYVLSSNAVINIIDINTPVLAAVTKHSRIKMEAIDGGGNTAQATRDMWYVTYNDPPTPPSQIDIFDDGGILKARATGATDSNIGTTWDGLIEYRWDFDNDGTWDTMYFNSDTVAIGAFHIGPKLACEARDRFGATTKVIISVTPEPPSDLIAAAGSATQINLTWTDNSAQELGFKVERALASAGPWTQIAIVPADTVSYSDTGLSEGTAYYYQVRAYNSRGDSVFSPLVSSTTLPNAPTYLMAQSLPGSQIKLMWTDNSIRETNYVIERAPTRDGPWTQVTIPSNSTSYIDTGLTEATFYYYRVKAYIASQSAYSLPSNIILIGTMLAVTPSQATATAISSTQIRLNWQYNATMATGFKIMRQKSTDTTWALIATITNISQRSYTNSGLLAETTYRYKIFAYKGAVYSDYSNIATCTTMAAPTNIIATALSASQIRLIWKDNSTKETGYRIMRSLDGIKYAKLKDLGANATTYTDINLLSGKRYYYYVYAINGGNYSSSSARITVTTLTSAK